jgi:hypothetical protein
MRKFTFVGLLFITLFSCKKEVKVNPNYEKEINKPEYIHGILQKYTDIIVHDIFSPPVASRNYLYPTVAARHLDPSYKTLAGQLRGLEPVPTPPAGQKICYQLASIKAMMMSCKKFIFSEGDLMHYDSIMMADIDAIGIPKDVYTNSIAYGEAVAKHINAWADTDTYKQSRSYPKFTVDSEQKARWKPTPPGYMDAIEPHWNKIRNLTMDSSSQFKPVPATAFNPAKGSKFMKETTEVYTVGKNLTEEQKQIANYWDCNPYKLNVIGHVMHATKKITPGGHWMSISRQISKQANADFVKTTMTYANVAIGLFDGFISCWDEKYRSNSVRPESVINELIDPNWVPLLQTPPFPEYTSGHSVISNASANILTSLYGENFAFTDSTEVEFGLGTRSYKSIADAAAEASVSRLYGGIHYRPAIDNGAVQGSNIGKHILLKIKFK